MPTEALVPRDYFIMTVCFGEILLSGVGDINYENNRDVTQSQIKWN
jgi:hypothetical protein